MKINNFNKQIKIRITTAQDLLALLLQRRT